MAVTSCGTGAKCWIQPCPNRQIRGAVTGPVLAYPVTWLGVPGATEVFKVLVLLS